MAAVALNGVIGRAGRLPWRLPEDLRRFRALTSGHCVVMGRRTWASIGHPLPHRTSIVVSRDPAFSAEGARVARDLDAAIAIARAQGETELFVIGGEALYRAALPRADAIHLTLVHAEVEGDARFPDFDPTEFSVAAEEHRPGDARHVFAMTFRQLVRRSGARAAG